MLARFLLVTAEWMGGVPVSAISGAIPGTAEEPRFPRYGDAPRTYGQSDDALSASVWSDSALSSEITPGGLVGGGMTALLQVSDRFSASFAEVSATGLSIQALVDAFRADVLEWRSPDSVLGGLARAHLVVSARLFGAQAAARAEVLSGSARSFPENGRVGSLMETSGTDLLLPLGAFNPLDAMSLPSMYKHSANRKKGEAQKSNGDPCNSESLKEDCDEQASLYCHLLRAPRIDTSQANSAKQAPGICRSCMHVHSEDECAEEFTPDGDDLCKRVCWNDDVKTKKKVLLLLFFSFLILQPLTLFCGGIIFLPSFCPCTAYLEEQMRNGKKPNPFLSFWCAQCIVFKYDGFACTTLVVFLGELLCLCGGRWYAVCFWDPFDGLPETQVGAAVQASGRKSVIAERSESEGEL